MGVGGGKLWENSRNLGITCGLPSPPPTHTLFIGVLGGLVQVFVLYGGTLLLRGVWMVPLCFGLNCFGGVSDGFGGWVSTGSPCGVELPAF